MSAEEIYRKLAEEFMHDPAPKAMRDFVRALLKNEARLDTEHFLQALKLIERVLS